MMDPEHGCFRKKRYSTKAFAEGVAREAAAKRGVSLKVYRCPHCRDYHLAKKRRKPEARR